MFTQAVSHSRRIRASRALGLVLTLALLFSPLRYLSPVATADDGQPVQMKVQPLLLEKAAEDPTALVDVIVQQAEKGERAEALVAQLGGVVTKDLHLISAFAAQIPAGKLLELAQAASVRWISLDAPLMSAPDGPAPDVSVRHVFLPLVAAPELTGSLALTTGQAAAQAAASPVGASIAVMSQISQSSDDAEEEGPNGANLGPGGVYLISTDLELVDDVEPLSSGTQTIGLRFNSIAIPSGARITNAAIRFRAVAADSPNTNANTAKLVIQGQAADNPSSFKGATRYDVSARPRTGAAVTWAPSSWAAGSYYDTPDLAMVAQEIVNRPGWSSGNSMVFVVTGSGSRSAESWDDSGTNPPKLAIAYTLDTSPTPAPTPVPTPAPTPTPATNPVFVTWASTLGTVANMEFTNPNNMIDEVALGPDGLYGYGAKVKGSFGGFDAEITPGYAISKVEVVLHGYALTSIDKDVRLGIFVTGTKQGEISKRAKDIFTGRIGAANAGPVYVDVTGLKKAWQWSDFANGLELAIEHRDFDASKNHIIYYDAIGLRVTGKPGVDQIDGSVAQSLPKAAIDTSKLVNAFNFAVRATDVWNEGPSYLQGQNVTVAMVDSGIGKNKDLEKRLEKSINFNSEYHDAKDRYGHGTFVASLIAGNGQNSAGKRMGIAPKANLLSVRVSNDVGMSQESDVVAALQWLYENRDRYAVRVVNLSLNSSVLQSYHTSPLAAAVEILWFNGIVVVISAGNNGTANVYPPANDPYVITVGAVDDRGTRTITDDVMTTFSAYGITQEGHAKPDLVAPGKNIVAYLPSNNKLTMGQQHQSFVVDKDYFRMSGTSMSAPMVAGAIALLLQDEPGLTPDQVKYRLKATANKSWSGYDAARAGAGYLDVYAAVHGTTTERANRGNVPQQMLAKMALIALWASNKGGSVDWGSVNWDSVNWDSVNWDSVNWDSVNWDSVNWDSVNWDSVNWDSVNWDSVNWDSVNWDSVNWDSVNWDSVNWDSVNWDSVNWDSDYWGN